MNRIDLRQFDTLSETSPQQSLQATVVAPEPEEDIHGLIEILGSTDITTQLVNIKEIDRQKNEHPRQVQLPKQADKHTLIETGGEIRMGYARVGIEEIALSLSKQGFRMIPDNTFGTF